MKLRGIGSGIALAALCATTPAQAQWNVTGVGVVEYDTNETLLLLAGVSAGPGGTGISPIFGVQGYRLTYEGGAGNDVTVTSIRPSVGIRNGFNGGAWQARVGYAFTDRDEDTGLGVLVPDGGGSDGVVTTAQVDWWGTGGPLGLQAIASYNFGGDALWTRGRATTRLGSLGAPGQVRLGGEVAYMTDDDFSAIQPGGVLEWHTRGGTILGLGAGVKISDDIDNATYFRAEVVLPISRR